MRYILSKHRHSCVGEKRIFFSYISAHLDPIISYVQALISEQSLTGGSPANDLSVTPSTFPCNLSSWTHSSLMRKII